MIYRSMLFTGILPWWPENLPPFSLLWWTPLTLKRADSLPASKVDFKVSVGDHMGARTQGAESSLQRTSVSLRWEFSPLQLLIGWKAFIELTSGGVRSESRAHSPSLVVRIHSSPIVNLHFIGYHGDAPQGTSLWPHVKQFVRYD